ncbi:APC family permease [Candidatus Jidaibacter acanthamoebae]|nr:amino acid permease [Candidatus Jidaibacter acanthamoeba]
MSSSVARKIGFWSLVSIVISSQVGSGIFMLPASLAHFGGIAAFSWVFTGCGAILLALAFAELSKRFPKNGGPHVFVQEAFGKNAAFFVAWGYWVISWSSTTAVIIASIGYFGSLFGGFDIKTGLILELLLLWFFTWINLKGVKASGYIEIVFTVLKVVPLIVLPIACIPHFQIENFIPLNTSGTSNLSALNAAALITFWGFIGVECATTPADSVDNPKRTIPRAIIFGTITVAIINLLCSLAIMGVVPMEQLKISKAPFTDAAKFAFGGNLHYFISLAAAVVCFGTLNAWILVSGQIALGAAQDGLFPKVFAKQNSNGSPYFSILAASLGMVPLILFTLNDNLVDQFTKIIDNSVTVFLIIYAICILSLLKILARDKASLISYIIAIAALLFCGWALFACSAEMIIISISVFLSGLPIYLLKK